MEGGDSFMFRNVTLRTYFSRKSEALGVVFKREYIEQLLSELKFDYVSFSFITGIFEGKFEPSVKLEKMLSEHWGSNLGIDIFDMVRKSGYLCEYLGQMSIIIEVRFMGEIIYIEVAYSIARNLYKMYRDIKEKETDPRYWQEEVRDYFSRYNISSKWIEKYL